MRAWGRNILPAPKRSPTTFMPSMRGPSMTCSGAGYLPHDRASSASCACPQSQGRGWGSASNLLMGHHHRRHYFMLRSANLCTSVFWLRNTLIVLTKFVELGSLRGLPT